MSEASQAASRRTGTTCGQYPAQRLPASWCDRGEPFPRVFLKDTFCPTKVMPNSRRERAPDNMTMRVQREVHEGPAGLMDAPTVMLGCMVKDP